MATSVDTSDLWVCPACGKKYVTPGTWHSCGVHTVDGYLAGKPPRALVMWDRLVEMVGSCGDFTLHASATRIGFMVRVRFAGVSALSARGMSLYFWLKRRISSPRFVEVEHVGGRDWIYRVRIERLDELDDEVQRWLCMAYEVGCQRA